MNEQQIRLLNEMKKLIKQGKRKFVIRKDRDYLSELFEIGITVEEAWEYVLSLNNHYYFHDHKFSYTKSENLLTFKRLINNNKVYIKIKIENNETVCLSFHKDFN